MISKERARELVKWAFKEKELGKNKNVEVTYVYNDVPFLAGFLHLVSDDWEFDSRLCSISALALEDIDSIYEALKGQHLSPQETLKEAQKLKDGPFEALETAFLLVRWIIESNNSGALKAGSRLMHKGSTSGLIPLNVPKELTAEHESILEIALSQHQDETLMHFSEKFEDDFFLLSQLHSAYIDEEKGIQSISPSTGKVICWAIDDNLDTSTMNFSEALRLAYLQKVNILNEDFPVFGCRSEDLPFEDLKFYRDSFIAIDSKDCTPEFLHTLTSLMDTHLMKLMDDDHFRQGAMYYTLELSAEALLRSFRSTLNLT